MKAARRCPRTDRADDLPGGVDCHCTLPRGHAGECRCEHGFAMPGPDDQPAHATPPARVCVSWCGRCGTLLLAGHMPRDVDTSCPVCPLYRQGKRGRPVRIPARICFAFYEPPATPVPRPRRRRR